MSLFVIFKHIAHLFLSFYCWVWVGKCQSQKILKLQWRWNDILKLNDFLDFINTIFLTFPHSSNKEVKNKFPPHPLHKRGSFYCGLQLPSQLYNIPDKNLTHQRNEVRKEWSTWNYIQSVNWLLECPFAIWNNKSNYFLHKFQTNVHIANWLLKTV